MERQTKDTWIFALTLASASATLVSIFLSELFFAAACVLWIAFRPGRVYLPRFVLPLGVFMIATLFSLALSPEPLRGFSQVFKFVLFPMALLAANFVSSPDRMKLSHRLLLIVATVSGTLAMIQFVINYLRYRQTGLEKDDPMIADRAVGFMSHWMTFSVGEMLVWCAAIPVIVVLSRRWLVPAVITGAAIILSFTRGVWIGSAAGLFSVVFALPRKVIVMILAPAAVVMLLASWPIYHRLSMSFQQGFAPDEGRQALLRAGVSMVRDNPLFGVGPERVSREFPNYHPKKEDLGRFYYGHMENNYMQIAAERGLITLGAFLWFFVELFRELWALRREKSEMSRTAALSGLAALAAFLVAGLFSYDFGDSESLLLFLFLVSAPLGLARRTAESTKHAKR